MEMLSLAFIGDAVHTLFIREHIVTNSNLKMDTANKIAASYCNAYAQAKALESLSPLLTEEEKEIVRRTRNIKNKHKAKNVDIMTYKEATCFEALIGHHYVQKNLDRLHLFLETSLQGGK